MRSLIQAPTDRSKLRRAHAARGPAVLAGMALLALGACDGPNEQAGREKDRAAAAAAGQNVTGEGPNERMGEAQDRVDQADRKARAAAADALESRGDQLRRQADIEADKLDKQARDMRVGNIH